MEFSTPGHCLELCLTHLRTKIGLGPSNGVALWPSGDARVEKQSGSIIQAPDFKRAPPPIMNITKYSKNEATAETEKGPDSVFLLELGRNRGQRALALCLGYKLLPSEWMILSCFIDWTVTASM